MAEIPEAVAVSIWDIVYGLALHDCHVQITGQGRRVEFDASVAELLCTEPEHKGKLHASLKARDVTNIRHKYPTDDPCETPDA